MGKKMSYCCQDKKYFSELCTACVEAMTTSGDLIYPFSSDYFDKEWPEVIFETRCECGSETVNGPGHSHWCPKYESK